MNIWPFSALKRHKQALLSAENQLYRARCTGRKMENELELSRMKLVAIAVGAQCNTRESAKLQRVAPGNPYHCDTVQNVYDAVDREIQLREDLEQANDRSFRASEAHVVTMGHFNQALDLIAEIVRSTETGRILDAANAAEDFLHHHRGTKVCIKCGSEMIPMHSEDKKLCSNGACGHEVEWKLAEGQQYQYKRNVEAFVEDRSGVQEELPPLERL